jgi:hypothetical protein
MKISSKEKQFQSYQIIIKGCVVVTNAHVRVAKRTNFEKREKEEKKKLKIAILVIFFKLVVI